MKWNGEFLVFKQQSASIFTCSYRYETHKWLPLSKLTSYLQFNHSNLSIAEKFQTLNLCNNDNVSLRYRIRNSNKQTKANQVAKMGWLFRFYLTIFKLIFINNLFNTIFKQKIDFLHRNKKKTVTFNSDSIKYSKYMAWLEPQCWYCPISLYFFVNHFLIWKA